VILLINFLKYILEIFYNLTNSYGLSIILLSLTVTVIMLPLFYVTEKLQINERARKEKMQGALDEIKNLKNKQEKYYYTKEIYRKNKYSLVYSLSGLLGLFIQIPFFLAAYWLLLEYTPLDGVSFGPIKDLFQTDEILSFEGFSINVLPIVMTFFNLFAGYLYSKNMNRIEQVQLVVIAFTFLILLYNLSAALVLYWTMNNIFAIGKNWVINNFINSKVNKLLEFRLKKLFGIASSQFYKIKNQILYIKIRLTFIKLARVRYYLVLLVLPYVYIICNSFDVFLICVLMLIIFGLIDIIFRKGNYILKHIYLAILISLFVFFYTNMISDFLQFIKEEFFLNNLGVRLRHVLLIFIILILVAFYKINHKKIYSIFSISVVIFLFVSFFQFVLKNYEIPRNYELISDNIFEQVESNYDPKKTIFLIFDAYSSPEEVSKLDAKIDTEKLVNYLKSNNWIVKREFYSLEGSTYNSVHSILNYNLSDRTKPNRYFNDFKKTFYHRTRGKTKLIEDLKLKKVNYKNYTQLKIDGIDEADSLNVHQSVNYGPFEYKFSELKSFMPFKNYIEDSELFFKFFGKSIFSQIFTNVLPFEARFPENNKKLFSLLNKNEIEKYDFLIYHFLMPHAPFSYFDEFTVDVAEKPTLQYAKFWDFTNDKIINFLKSIDYSEYRVIISTDHGYRHSSKLNRLNTFGAFYGFDESDVKKVEYVQDIGSLIKHSFK